LVVVENLKIVLVRADALCDLGRMTFVPHELKYGLPIGTGPEGGGYGVKSSISVLAKQLLLFGIRI